MHAFKQLRYLYCALFQPSDLQVFGHRQCLYGHAGPITSMYVSKPFSVIVTASQDTTAIIWDLNRYAFVQTTALGST